MTGARVRGVQQEEGKACFSGSLRDHSMPFKLDSEHSMQPAISWISFRTLLLRVKSPENFSEG